VLNLRTDRSRSRSLVVLSDSVPSDILRQLRARLRLPPGLNKAE
jgi:hypothetical protein